VKQFSHGQSNPTYLLILPDRKLVLRKKPPGTSYLLLLKPEKEIFFSILSNLIPKLWSYGSSSTVIFGSVTKLLSIPLDLHAHYFAAFKFA
jgi:hypothetical protein